MYVIHKDPLKIVPNDYTFFSSIYLKDPDASIFPNMRFRDRDPPTSILNMSNLSSRDCPDKSFKPIFAKIVVYNIRF